MKVIYVDIDETICNRESSTDFGVVHDYTKAEPIQENIDKINKLYDEGNTIVYWTCLLYTSPSPRDLSTSRMPSSA